MSSIEHTRPAPAVARLGQATAIEQSRAAAEVHAAVLIAQQCPRDVQAAIAEMKTSCAQMALAERAFYRFPRSGSTVSGPSIFLARELARCWGNIQYGIAELSRDDEHGQSEMQAFAWDVQTNTRNAQIFIVPHMRDKRGGAEKLVDMRDIYENNANMGARRVRESIFAILPPWFVEQAKEICTATLKDGGGKPLAQRVAEAITAFGGIGITQDQIERKLERPAAKWIEQDVAQLSTVFTSIRQGTVTKEDEFPPVGVTAAEVRQAAPVAPAPVLEPVTSEPAAEMITKPQLAKLHATLTELGVKERDDKLQTVSVLLKRELGSSSEMTKVEASGVIDLLDRLLESDEPVKALDAVIVEMVSHDGAGQS